MALAKSLLLLPLLVEYSSSSFLLPDTSFRMTYCLGPNCPSVSLPYIGEKDGGNFSDKCNGTNKVQFIPDPVDCHSYIACGVAAKLTCTLGYAFHPEFEVCVPDTLVKGCRTVYCPPTMLVGTVPDPKSCNRYYKCIYGAPLHFQCDLGYGYDEETGKCKSFGGNGTSCVVNSEDHRGSEVVETGNPELDSAKFPEQPTNISTSVANDNNTTEVAPPSPLNATIVDTGSVETSQTTNGPSVQ